MASGTCGGPLCRMCYEIVMTEKYEKLGLTMGEARLKLTNRFGKTLLGPPRLVEGSLRPLSLFKFSSSIFNTPKIVQVLSI